MAYRQLRSAKATAYRQWWAVARRRLEMAYRQWRATASQSRIIPSAAWAVQTREGQLCTPPPRLWQRRPRNLLLVMVLLLLLGSPRVHRDTVSVAVSLRLEGFGPSRGKTIT